MPAPTAAGALARGCFAADDLLTVPPLLCIPLRQRQCANDSSRGGGVFAFGAWPLRCLAVRHAQISPGFLLNPSILLSSIFTGMAKIENTRRISRFLLLNLSKILDAHKISYKTTDHIPYFLKTILI